MGYVTQKNNGRIVGKELYVEKEDVRKFDAVAREVGLPLIGLVESLEFDYTIYGPNRIRGDQKPVIGSHCGSPGKPNYQLDAVLASGTNNLRLRGANGARANSGVTRRRIIDLQWNVSSKGQPTSPIVL